jgi:hypothetical protein
MLSMKHVLAILPLLALSAAAQEDLLQSLAPGDRLQVTFRSGGTLIGSLVPPPPAGAAATRKKGPALGVQAPATPFTLLYVAQGSDADAQTAILEPWLKQHPEGQFSRVAADQRDAAALLKAHNILATPAIVLQDSSSGMAQTFLGLQSAERLEAALGKLRSKVQEAKVDFSKEEYLTLDVSLEYPGLNGTMSVARKDIKEIRKLQKLDEATRRRLEEEHRKIRESQAAEERTRREAEVAKTETAKADIEKAEQDEKRAKEEADKAKALEAEAAKLKAQEELLKQFPPEQWSEERKQVILNKTLTMVPVTLEEKAFLEKQAEWVEAVKALKEKQAKDKAEKEKATQEEKK